MTYSDEELDNRNLKAGGQRHWTLPKFGFWEVDRTTGKAVHLHSGLTWDKAVRKAKSLGLGPEVIGVVITIYPQSYEEQLSLL